MTESEISVWCFEELYSKSKEVEAGTGKQYRGL